MHGDPRGCHRAVCATLGIHLMKSRRDELIHISEQFKSVIPNCAFHKSFSASVGETGEPAGGEGRATLRSCGRCVPFPSAPPCWGPVRRHRTSLGERQGLAGARVPACPRTPKSWLPADAPRVPQSGQPETSFCRGHEPFARVTWVENPDECPGETAGGPGDSGQGPGLRGRTSL